jgi:acetyl esterase/lipase
MIVSFQKSVRGGLAALALAALIHPAAAQSSGAGDGEVVRLWPGQAPGTESWTGPETIKTDPNNPFGPIQVKSNVTVPTLTVVRPAPGKANGTAIVVLPGGAFQILAWDIEGTEVARRLADRGITAFLLKYRVRPGEADPAKPAAAALMDALQSLRKIAIADAAQSVRIVRRDAARFGIRPDRVGMMGFSAGAIATLGLLLEGDPAARPNFAASIYGTPLMEKPVVPANAPPIFIASAQDDFLSAGSVETYTLWSTAKRPAELHIYDKGGHGFGMRAKNLPVGGWPLAFDAWLTRNGYLPALSARP